MALDPYEDPRDEAFVISKDLISDEALDSIIESYCTEFHGTNDIENPLDHKETVRKAMDKGDLKLFFDPVENKVALRPTQQ